MLNAALLHWPRELQILVLSCSFLAFFVFALQLPRQTVLQVPTSHESLSSNIGYQPQHFPLFYSSRFREIVEQEHKNRVKILRDYKRTALIKATNLRFLHLLRFFLESNGFDALTTNSISGLDSSQTGNKRFFEEGESRDWALVLSFSQPKNSSSSRAFCNNSFVQSDFPQHFKYSWFPSLSNLLFDKSEFCRFSNFLERNRVQLSFSSCFILTQDYESFLDALDASESEQLWLIQRPTQTLQVSTQEIFRMIRAKEFYWENNSGTVLSKNGIQNELIVSGCLISLQIYVLITSIAPWRIYAHSRGHVFFHNTGQEDPKQRGKSWELEEFWRFLQSSRNCDPLATVVPSIDRAITQFFLDIESRLTNFSTSDFESTQCNECYELLTLTLKLDSSLKPYLVSIDRLQRFDVVPEDVLRDNLNIILARSFVGDSLMSALDRVSTTFKVGVLGIECWMYHELCLTKNDIFYLIQTRREDAERGRYRRIYPSYNGENNYFNRNQSWPYQFRDGSRKKLVRNGFGHTTEELDRILSYLEAEFMGSKIKNKDNFSFPFGTSQNDTQRKKLECVEDETSKTYLKSIFITPHLRLNPTFSSGWGTYNIMVPYENVLIQILAVSQHCQTEVRFQHISGPKRSMNLTLGLGTTKLNLLVVDIKKEATLNSYYLTFRRDRSDGREPKFESSEPHQVCALRQECSYRIDAQVPCGIHPEKKSPFSAHSWQNFLNGLDQSPKCSSADKTGRWLLPCSSSSCASCWWSKAIWQPYTCSYASLSQSQLMQCFKNKTLLFLGDSTNRGMMQRIFERLDSGLLDKDKTHDLKVYESRHLPGTSFSFAYYPQFWVPAPQRPVFKKTLYRLLIRSWPLSNSTDVVLVVGGVQWLESHHLLSMLEILDQEGLSGIKVVIKTLGSGFHIPSAGVHYISKNQREKLMLHSQSLVGLARHHGLQVLETYNMTAARHNDFLQGNCACHFHEVQENEDKTGYSVIGEINKIYSDILVNLICDGG